MNGTLVMAAVVVAVLWTAASLAQATPQLFSQAKSPDVKADWLKNYPGGD